MIRSLVTTSVVAFLLGTANVQAQAGTIELCGVSTSYTPRRPGPNIPPEFAKFFGVWIGTWDRKQCAALAFEEIRPDGSVRVKVAWGRNFYDTPKASRYAGTIKDGILTLPGDSMRVQYYRFKGPDELEGHFVIMSGERRGVLSRATTP